MRSGHPQLQAAARARHTVSGSPRWPAMWRFPHASRMSDRKGEVPMRVELETMTVRPLPPHVGSPATSSPWHGVAGPESWTGGRLRLWSPHAYWRRADRHRWRADRVVAAAAGSGSGTALATHGGAAIGPGHQHHLAPAGIDRD